MVRPMGRCSGKPGTLDIYLGYYYRLSAQGRSGPWSNALARYGSNPLAALATVLGVAAEDIQIGEARRARTPAKASTVPQAPPNNPNPNTAVAQPSNTEPGFPSGDN
jgi:hypothetical protein